MKSIDSAAGLGKLGTVARVILGVALLLGGIVMAATAGEMGQAALPSAAKIAGVKAVWQNNGPGGAGERWISLAYYADAACQRPLESSRVTMSARRKAISLIRQALAQALRDRYEDEGYRVAGLAMTRIADRGRVVFAAQIRLVRGAGSWYEARVRLAVDLGRDRVRARVRMRSLGETQA